MNDAEGQLQSLIRQKVVDALEAPIPAHTRREIRIVPIPSKAKVVIGMRRSGKTTFLWQCLADRFSMGIPREGLLYFSFEDERLADLAGEDLQWIVETYFSLQPQYRDGERATFFFDEIQLVPGWERFARRLMDTENVELFLSGSSARLLSREVATSMRGRGVEVLVHPFSFREFLRHRGEEPERPWADMGKSMRSKMNKMFGEYLVEGGFPEAQGLSVRDRATLLRTYVDVATLRDVIERHAVSNPTALRWMQRHLLGNPASSFSIQKFYAALKSQGIPVSKDTLHEYLAHLEDAFLIRTVPMHTASERRRMVNPRKAYPVDPGLIPLYERTGRSNTGHALEAVVLLELERRGYEVGYYRSREGYEVDFVAVAPEGSMLLIQVCAEMSDTDTWMRELRGLLTAAEEYPAAVPLLLTSDILPPKREVPPSVYWLHAGEWLLQGVDSGG
jgi:hypothetical protein